MDPYVAQPNKGGTRRAKTHERGVAASLGGRRQPGSGSSQRAKGDVKVTGPDDTRLLVECKTTMHGSLTVQAEWLVKISAEAMAQGCYPALAIEIDATKMADVASRMGKSIPENRWVALPESVLSGIMERLNADR